MLGKRVRVKKWNAVAFWSYGQSRTRRVAPSVRALAGATEYRGYYLFQRARKIDIWCPATAEWSWHYNTTCAKAWVDERTI